MPTEFLSVSLPRCRGLYISAKKDLKVYTRGSKACKLQELFTVVKKPICFLKCLIKKLATIASTRKFLQQQMEWHRQGNI